MPPSDPRSTGTRSFRDGAWLVELAEVRDPALVGNAALAALDLRDQAAIEPRALLLSYLQDKELLLVVDNCEHLLGAAAVLVTDVLKAAPGVRVIATSREPLSVPGEHVLPIPPLELPRAQADESLDQLRQNESVELFTERASAASGRFELTASNQGAVVDLCRRLDGLPLAIELAAVRTRVLRTGKGRGRSNTWRVFGSHSPASGPTVSPTATVRLTVGVHGDDVAVLATLGQIHIRWSRVTRDLHAHLPPEVFENVADAIGELLGGEYGNPIRSAPSPRLPPDPTVGPLCDQPTNVGSA